MPFDDIIKKKHPLIERIVIYAGHVYRFIYHKYVCFSFACPFVKYTCNYAPDGSRPSCMCIFFQSADMCNFFNVCVIFLVCECDSMCNFFRVCMCNFFSV